MSQHRIVICDELAPQAMEVFQARGLKPEVMTGLKGEELHAALADADAIVVRSATKLTKEVLAAAKKVKVIGRAGIGVDNIDVPAATAQGIVVMNTPLGNTTTTAELALALLFSIARHIPRADRTVRSGSWKKKALVGTEITGKTLGIIGLGRIGRIVADRARGLGMQVIAFDPYLDAKSAPAGTPELLELPEMLARVDFLTIHVPLVPATKNLISWKELQGIKPGARLINASRGGVVDEEAVLDALSDGRLAGAAFDVLAEEPPGPDHPLIGRDDVIVTPHLGASSSEAQLRVAVDIAEQISEYLLNGVAKNAINAPSIPEEHQRELAPFLTLAEKLGSFLAQRIGKPIRKVEFTVAGEVVRLGTEHLRLAFLTGVLKSSMESGVNAVNAPALAKERGILVLENSETDAAYSQGEIRITASERAGGEAIFVSGAVFGNAPRITSINGVRVDLAPRGHLLLTQHTNRPGMVGHIGTVLGQHHINIHRLELGQPQHGQDGPSFGFLTLQAPPEGGALREGGAALQEIQAIEGIQRAQYIEL